MYYHLNYEQVQTLLGVLDSCTSGMQHSLTSATTPDVKKIAEHALAAYQSAKEALHCPKSVNDARVLAGVEACDHLQKLLDLHIAHHNHPEHAAARAFLRQA